MDIPCGVPASTTLNSEFKSCEMPFSYLIAKIVYEHVMAAEVESAHSTSRQVQG